MVNQRKKSIPTEIVGDTITIIPVDNQAELFQVTTSTDNNTGTALFEIQTYNGGPFEDLIDDSTDLQQTIDTSSNILSFSVKGYIWAMRVTTSGVTGTATVMVQQGDD